MKEYTRDITIIVSNTFTNIGVKSRLYSLMKWVAFPGFAKNNNNNNDSNNNNSNNKIMQSTVESISFTSNVLLFQFPIFGTTTGY